MDYVVDVPYGLLFDCGGKPALSYQPVVDQYFADGTFNSGLNEGLFVDLRYADMHTVIFNADLEVSHPLNLNWQLPKVPILNSSGGLASKIDVGLFIDGTAVSGAIDQFDVSTGYITLQSSNTFWNLSALGRPPRVTNWTSYMSDGTGYSTQVPGDSVEFYFYYGQATGSVDSSSAIPAEDPLLIGYRYRTDLLHHASVLNSPDTLLLNEYQKPANRASIANQEAVLNHFNYFFSPEFLYDENPVEKPLGDNYLDNGLDPVVKLREGTPTFQQTFAYQPGLIYQKKLQDIRKNHRLLMYADLLQKEFPNGDDVPISSICDSDNPIFKTRVDEDPYQGPYECQPWELFDTVDVVKQAVQLPGDYKGEIGRASCRGRV
jgi:hypothetical protein